MVQSFSDVATKFSNNCDQIVVEYNNNGWYYGVMINKHMWSPKITS